MELILQNVNVFDTISKQIHYDKSVILRGQQIERISDSRLDSSLPETIDCDGGYLLPGLIDCHVHMMSSHHVGPSMPDPGPEFIPRGEDTRIVSKLHSYLYCGVTSVYDSGNVSSKIYRIRDQERNNEILSPRVFCSGRIVSCPGGHGSPYITPISSLPADSQRLEEHLSSRPDLVKVAYDEHNWGIRPLIPILSEETLRGIIDFCHWRKNRVTVHVSNELRAREAVACGADALAHPVIQSPNH
ncbi:MAG: amidohydrolase family protein [Nitrososphaerales archaeon]